MADATATPDYSYTGWLAMLFAAGMGIGLVFYGVSEPVSHFTSSMGGIVSDGGARTDWAPLGAAAGDADASRRLAMAATISTGVCIPGPSTRLLAYRWPSSPITRVFR